MPRSVRCTKERGARRRLVKKGQRLFAQGEEPPCSRSVAAEALANRNLVGATNGTGSEWIVGEIQARQRRILVGEVLHRGAQRHLPRQGQQGVDGVGEALVDGPAV